MRSASLDDSPRGALHALPELGGRGPPPGGPDGTGGVGPGGLDPLASTMWKGKKGEQRDIVFGLMKKMSSTIVPRYMHT